MRPHFGKVFKDNVYTPLSARIKCCADRKNNMQCYFYKISHRDKHNCRHKDNLFCCIVLFVQNLTSRKTHN